jgi:DNA-binding NarL/FixJ family response regulator
VSVVIVADPLPLWRLGAAAALARWPVHLCDPVHLTQAIEDTRPQLVLLTLTPTQELHTLAGVTRLPEPPQVVAVLTDADPASCATALRAGAVGVLPHDCPPRHLRRAVRVALSGRVDLPIPVLRQLTSITHHLPAQPEPVAADLELITALASGVTVARIAEQAGYSERAMFRRLKQLYVRLGVEGRYDLLETAHRRGWL